MSHVLTHRSRLLLTLLAVAGTITIVVGMVWQPQETAPPGDQPAATSGSDPAVQRWAADQVVDQLPAFALPDLSGELRSISEWHGDILVINVWATWCGPCREEVPMLVKAQRTHGDRGVTVIGLTLDSPVPTREFAEAFSINYPLLIDDSTDRPVVTQLGSDALGLPHTFIVDREGSIQAFHLGLMTAEALDRALEPLLNEH